jgi:cell wall-associated NlpC family hydrolase
MPRIDSVDFLTGGDMDTVDPQTEVQKYSSFKAFALANGIPCDGTGGAAKIPVVAQAMVGKITYSMEKRGQTCANNTFCLDCSGFINAVYSCVGISSPGYTTLGIFPNGNTPITSKTDTSINGKTLSNGDLIGWIKGSRVGGKVERFGHVVMYIGNGKVIESTGANKNPGKAIKIKNTTDYGQRLKSFKDI